MWLNSVYVKSLNRLRCINSKVFILIFLITFSIFVFTSDGHRYTFDEGIAQDQAIRIATMEPHPDYIQGESRIFFEYTWLYPPYQNERPICENAILCSQASVIHSTTEALFLTINENFHIITNETIEITPYEFNDPAYAFWRNSINPSFTFMELLYGPFFSALSVAVLFLVSRTYTYSLKTSIIISFLFAFTTIIWAYSQTSLNSVLVAFFLLSGFFFYRKFQKTNSHFNLILTGIFFGVAFLTRNDMILIIAPFFIFLLITSFWKNIKLKTYFTFVKTFFAFVIPVTSSYVIQKIIEYARVGSVPTETKITALPSTWAAEATTSSTPYFLQLFGVIFSPGAGLFIYSPILFASFVGFFDFYKKNKLDCILFLSFIGILAIFFAAGSNWHGFNGWGSRYMLPVIPFLMIPIAASIEKRMHFSFKIPVIFLGITGFLINLVYLLQDVSYFVWGFFGSDDRGLYSLGRKADGGVFELWINPVIIWTFEFSQIAQSTMMLLAKPQLDLLLLRIFGIELFLASLVAIIIILFYMLVKVSRNYIIKQKL